MEWWWNRGVERGKTIKEMLNVFQSTFSRSGKKQISRICTCKTEKTLQISGKCVQFTQSCLRTPPSYFFPRKQSRKINAMRRVVLYKELSVISHKIWRSLLANWICYIAAKTTTSLWNGNEKETGKQGKCGHRLIVHSITHRGEIWRRGGEGVKWRDSGRGGGAGGGRLLCINL